MFPIGTPVNFDTSATAAAGTTAYAAAARINSDIDKQAAIGTFYWAASGSITVTQLGETAGSVIQGEVMTTSYHEVDQATGVAIADGCTTSLVALKFNVLHQPVFAD